ncbi:sugar phosphate isomerase/epimerase family protein [Paenibacillus humicola]|uniref:sugar phosphate isomerase/epimerase family protein n=1 Tax=Paenibacillus humicola TaxID=3110540 RepID=UPI00237AC638|nr:sugar phosphate isomerase/epimerase family protein [Paenibacillus humicola]
MFPFKCALNASTLFPFKLGLKEQIRIAAEAGYEGIEIWVRDMEAYTAEGGSLGELKRYAADSGIAIANAIAFFKWSDKDAEVRSAGFAQAEREMNMLAELACAAVAAPPFGDVEGVPLDDMAANYAALSELGRKTGVEPYLEFWGRAKRLSTLAEAIYVAVQSGESGAKLLLDPFHMYTGGSEISGVGFLNGERIGIVHVNDYPAQPERAVIADRDRVFPGEGVAPTARFAKLLHESGYRGFLSLELFIEHFGAKSALEVASEGLGKIRSAYSL